MPELPEVECLMRALRGQILGGEITNAKFYRPNLRDPIPIKTIQKVLCNQPLEDVYRRSKYIILKTRRGSGIIHLGMTGNIIALDDPKPSKPHTHAVFSVKNKKNKQLYLHYVDPRRFGRIDCTTEANINEHKFFKDLGPEPLLMKKLGAHLFEKSRKRKQPIKSFIMDAKNVVGVGNIYASEALFRTGVKPSRSAHSLNQETYAHLAKHIQATLKDAIKAGGTTFRDYKSLQGESGYFAVKLSVYDRKAEPCLQCTTPIKQLVQAGRSTYFCPTCQT